MDKKKDEKNIHAGHRERLLNLAVNAGIDSMSDIQVMEFFLTYIFPRGDVNPLAHRLLKEYESFTHVVDANYIDLMRIKGLNDRSAKRISMFKELFYHFTTARMGKKCIIKNVHDAIDLVEDHLRFRINENMILFALSPVHIVTHKRRINNDSSSEVGINTLEFTSFLASSKPAALVVGHCHPYGSAIPSKADEKAFQTMTQICETCGINMIDSYILGEDGVYSQNEKRFKRQYFDVEQLTSTIKKIAGQD